MKGKYILYGALVPFAIVLIVIFLELVFTPLGLFNKAMETADKITNPDRMIYTYEHYHDTCSAIRSVELKIDSVQQLMDTTEPTSDEKKMHLTNISGLNARRADLISEYNSLSRQSTREWFKGRSLPYRIPQEAYDGTNKTHCE